MNADLRRWGVGVATKGRHGDGAMTKSWVWRDEDIVRHGHEACGRFGVSACGRVGVEVGLVDGVDGVDEYEDEWRMETLLGALAW
jgi:hypothetical protein